MSSGTVLDPEEYVEQAYFFRVLRERIADNISAQEALAVLHEEVLPSTRLPLAIQFLGTELKHTGLLGSGFSRLPHYFTPFQAFVICQAEEEKVRLPMTTALLVLEREAAYRAGQPTPSGLFVYQFETICRNRLGYDEGLRCMAADPFYDADWRAYLEQVRRRIGSVDFAELVYVRSELYVADQRRADPGYQPPIAPLVGLKEGRIAKASRGRDPLYLFAALQRQLQYPEVPRPRPRDDTTTRLDAVQAKMRELEARLRLLESEQRGTVDLSQFGKPEILKDLLKEADPDE